jgi:hypothetical protein
MKYDPIGLNLLVTPSLCPGTAVYQSDFEIKLEAWYSDPNFDPNFKVSNAFKTFKITITYPSNCYGQNIFP